MLAAEEEMLDRDRKLEEGEAERLRAAFARLNSQERSGGSAMPRSAESTPFSRNDEWELSELRSCSTAIDARRRRGSAALEERRMATTIEELEAKRSHARLGGGESGSRRSTPRGG